MEASYVMSNRSTGETIRRAVVCNNNRHDITLRVATGYPDK